MNFLFYHLRQSKRNPSRYLLTLWGNTIGYMSITNQYHKYELMPASSDLVAPYSLMMRASPLMVSRDVPNYPITRSAGTALEDGRNS